MPSPCTLRLLLCGHPSADPKPSSFQPIVWDAAWGVRVRVRVSVRVRVQPALRQQS